MDIDIGKWHPVGFVRDQFASRGWGSLVESVVVKPITFEELVGRYNALLVAAQHGVQPTADADADTPAA